MNVPAINLNQAVFVTAAHNPSQWLPDSGREVAFAGRSNSGKSSALNLIAGQKRLAIASKMPGRTQQIVFFAVTEQSRLVDLPGYGYSKVPQKMRRHWGRTIEYYLSTRESLAGLIHTMDIRHPLKPQDVQLLQWCANASIRTHVLLTKCDKLSKSKIHATVASVCRELEPYQHAQVQAFSSTSGFGANQARERIGQWLLNLDDAEGHA